MICHPTFKVSFPLMFTLNGDGHVKYGNVTAYRGCGGPPKSVAGASCSLSK